MARRYLFADEAGDFEFRTGHNISRYFIVCTMTLDDCKIGNDLLDLRRQLAWEGLPVKSYFHATTDAVAVRDRVYDLILNGNYAFRIQATVMDKRKALPRIRPTAERFFQYGWYYHFKHSIKNLLPDGDELLIVTASIGTKERTTAEHGIETRGKSGDAVRRMFTRHGPSQRTATSTP